MTVANLFAHIAVGQSEEVLDVLAEAEGARIERIVSAGHATAPGQWYDRYKGVKELMPFAKGVSAKSHEFDADGNEVQTDFVKMVKIVLDAGYHGYIGIEWEGEKPDEVEGVKLTKKLLERVRNDLAKA